MTCIRSALHPLNRDTKPDAVASGGRCVRGEEYTSDGFIVFCLSMALFKFKDYDKAGLTSYFHWSVMAPTARSFPDCRPVTIPCVVEQVVTVSTHHVMMFTPPPHILHGEQGQGWVDTARRGV